jgi:Mrp family chromosome partitioning ATPase
LVDADLHNPTLHRLFDIVPSFGLDDVLRGGESVSSTLRATGVSGLRLLAGHVADGSPSELVGGPRMRAVLDALQEEAEVVLVDTPPAATCDESISLAMLCDAVIQLIPGNIVSDGADLRLRDELRAVGANLVGLILTRVEPTSVDSYVYDNARQRQRRWRLALTGASLGILVAATLWLVRAGAALRLLGMVN